MIGNTIALLAIIGLVSVQLGASFLKTKDQLIFISPWLPVIITIMTILLICLRHS